MFLNNTPIVAAIMLCWFRSPSATASSVLMPVGFATIIGGMSTTIGTSTNLLVVSIAHDMGMRELQMFDFALPVFIVGGVAILYLWLVAPRLLPVRQPPLTDVSPRHFDSRLRINAGSRADGISLADLLALAKGKLRIRRIMRGDLSLARLPSLTITAGDYLHISDSLENMKVCEHLLGATLVMSDTDQPVDADHRLASKQRVAEVVVMHGSRLDQGTLESSKILTFYGLQPIALHRPGRSHADDPGALAEITLRAGDVILLQGSSSGIERLKRHGQVLVLDGNIDLPRPGKASMALLIMAGVIVFAGLGLVRISLAAVAGIMLMVATGCLTWNDVRGAIDRRFILVIVTSLGLGLALMTTGAAEYIAHLYVALTDGLPVAVILSGLILIMALLTEVVTNNAIAVLGTPIAISIAAALGVPAEPFVLAVLYGANMSYLTPIGYQTNLLVMSAGGYHFSDFLRAGIPLQIIMWLGISIVLPIVYGL
jgi:di/tricarboxylate transporter